MLLLVTADDFGLTEGVSKGIVEAHRRGVVTGTSVLAVAPNFGRSVRLLDDAPNLDVGVHLAVVGEDPPLLTAREIPSLVDRNGSFEKSWRSLLHRWRGVDVEDLRREWNAQIEYAVSSGVGPTHLDSHQHVHLIPRFGNVLIELALAWNITTVRSPRARSSNPLGVAVSTLGSRFASRATRAGLATTSRFAGVEGAGAMSIDRVVKSLTRLSRTDAASVELNMHPGLPDDPERVRYRWNYQWSAEFQALVDPTLRDRLNQMGYKLARRSELPGRA